MSFTTELSHCTSIKEVENFCYKALNRNAIEFNGRQYVDKTTGEKLKLNKIFEKIESFNQGNSQDAEQACEVLANLRQLSESHATTREVFKQAFGRESKYAELENQYKESVRKSHDTMSAIMRDYNDLARKINQQIDGRTKAFGRTYRNEEQFKADLNRLKYLNIFLGVKWDSAQKRGLASVPLCNAGEIPAAPAPRSLNPSDCPNLAALYSLVKELKDNHAMDQRDGTLKTQATLVSIGEIEKRFSELYHREMKHDPYRKTDTYMQAASLLFTLNKMTPMSRAVRTTYEECLKGVREDSKSMKKVEEGYNALANKINEQIQHAISFDKLPLDLAHRETHLDQMEFYNEFIGLPLKEMHLQQKVLFPTVWDAKDPLQKLHASQRYNSGGVILNYELHVCNVHDRYNKLQLQLDNKNLNASLLSAEDREAIQEEMGQLESELRLLGPKMEDALYESLLQEQLSLAKYLGIPLNKTQMAGKEPFPLLGRELPPPKLRKPLTRLPQLVEKYNFNAKQANTRRKLREVKFQDFELRRKSLERFGTGRSLVESEDTILFFERFEKQIKDLESSVYRVMGDRFAYQCLGDILLTAEAYGFTRLSEKQKYFEEDLPIIELKQLPIPQKEEFFEELTKMSSEEVQRVSYNLPESWKAVLYPKQSQEVAKKGFLKKLLS